MVVLDLQKIAKIVQRGSIYPTHSYPYYKHLTLISVFVATDEPVLITLRVDYVNKFIEILLARRFVSLPSVINLSKHLFIYRLYHCLLVYIRMDSQIFTLYFEL